MRLRGALDSRGRSREGRTRLDDEGTMATSDFFLEGGSDEFPQIKKKGKKELLLILFAGGSQITAPVRTKNGQICTCVASTITLLILRTSIDESSSLSNTD